MRDPISVYPLMALAAAFAALALLCPGAADAIECSSCPEVYCCKNHEWLFDCSYYSTNFQDLLDDPGDEELDAASVEVRTQSEVLLASVGDLGQRHRLDGDTNGSARALLSEPQVSNRGIHVHLDRVHAVPTSIGRKQHLESLAVWQATRHLPPAQRGPVEPELDELRLDLGVGAHRQHQLVAPTFP